MVYLRKLTVCVNPWTKQRKHLLRLANNQPKNLKDILWEAFTTDSSQGWNPPSKKCKNLEAPQKPTEQYLIWIHKYILCIRIKEQINIKGMYIYKYIHIYMYIQLISPLKKQFFKNHVYIYTHCYFIHLNCFIVGFLFINIEWTSVASPSSTMHLALGGISWVHVRRQWNLGRYICKINFFSTCV